MAGMMTRAGVRDDARVGARGARWVRVLAGACGSCVRLARIMRRLRIARSGSAAVRPDAMRKRRACVRACGAAGDRVTAVSPCRT